MYRPPNSDIQLFYDELSALLNQLNKSDREIYILGDYNIDLLKYDNHSLTTDFVNAMFSMSFIPLVNRPTRVTDSSATIIDNIFTNTVHMDKCVTGILPTDITDHFPVFHLVNHQIVEKHPEQHRTYRVLNEESISKCTSILEHTCWDSVMNSAEPQTAYNNFIEIFDKIINDNIPLKNAKLDKKRDQKPWITRDLLRLIVEKNNLYLMVKRSGDMVLDAKYKKFKNWLNNKLRSAEKSFNNSLLESSKHNMSKLWKSLNTIINRKKTIKKNTIFKHNGIEISDHAEIAEHFNKYFLHHQCTNSNSTDDVDPSHYVCKNVANSIFLTPTDENEFFDILLELKNSSAGHDGISMKMLKLMKNYIVGPLVHIFNTSFVQGKVPDALKIARVVPILKKGDPSIFSNYRPISVLPSISKLLEKLVYKRIITFLDSNNILHDNQFGFRKHRSTEHAVQFLTHKFYEAVESNNYMMSIFLDFSRAFDTLSHNILMKKLYHYGFRGKTFDWIENYLTNRKQFVQYNDKVSKLANIVNGVPQGSILGPLLFILYVNDIYHVSNYFNCILYADDTTLLASGANPVDMIRKVNDELQNIGKWITINKLSVNISKCSYMMMSTPQKGRSALLNNVSLNGQSISEVDKTTFLGVVVDKYLSWKDHITYISNKISKGIGILIRTRHLLFRHTLLYLYNSLIKPHFTYCISTWGNTSKTHTNKLIILQKKVVRIISYADFHAHTKLLLFKLNILTVVHLYQYAVCKLIYNSLHGTAPIFLCTMFEKNRNKRNSQNLRSFYHKKKLSEQGVKYCGPQIWNKLPLPCKLSKTSKSFQKSLTKYLVIQT